MGLFGNHKKKPVPSTKKVEGGNGIGVARVKRGSKYGKQEEITEFYFEHVIPMTINPANWLEEARERRLNEIDTELQKYGTTKERRG